MLTDEELYAKGFPEDIQEIMKSLDALEKSQLLSASEKKAGKKESFKN